MPGYFEDEELEPDEESRDTEVTLRPSALVAILVGLVLLCGLCFGLGYVVGHRTPATSSAAATPPPAQTEAPDQEPLESNGTIPKPPAAAQAAVPGSAAASDGAQPSAAGEGMNPQTPAAQPSSGSGQSGPQSSPAAGAAQPAAQPQVRQAMPSTANPPQPAATGATPNVQAALPTAGQLMVQVAAVSHSEDADVLVGALRKRGYAVTARRDPGDGLIHVRVGPFNSRDEANRWRTKLLDDGYNAIIQP